MWQCGNHGWELLYLVLDGVTEQGTVPVPPDGAEGRALHYAGEADLGDEISVIITPSNTVQ